MAGRRLRSSPRSKTIWNSRRHCLSLKTRDEVTALGRPAGPKRNAGGRSRPRRHPTLGLALSDDRLVHVERGVAIRPQILHEADGAAFLALAIGPEAHVGLDQVCVTRAAGVVLLRRLDASTIA